MVTTTGHMKAVRSNTKSTSKPTNKPTTKPSPKNNKNDNDNKNNDADDGSTPILILASPRTHLQLETGNHVACGIININNNICTL